MIAKNQKLISVPFNLLFKQNKKYNIQIFQQTRFNFAYSKSMYVKTQLHNDKFMTSIDQRTKQLRPLSESKGIVDFDDKFGLSQIKSYKVLLNHLEEANYSYKLNDLVYFLQKLAELKKQGNFQDSDLLNNKKFQQFTNNIKYTLRIGNHKAFPNIGSIAYSLKQLNYKDQDMWDQIEKKVLEDDWYTNFKESVYMLEALTDYYQDKDQERIDKVYKKIERITNLTVWEVDMTYYKRIVEALVQVNRAPHNLFAKIENHVLNNLSMPYEIETIVDILFAFNRADKGSKKFYDALQYTIYKGHLFEKNPLLHGLMQLPFSGRVVSKLTEIYGKTMEREQEFVLSPDFRTMLYKYIQNNKTKYELPDIINLISHLKPFEYEDQIEIEENVFQKIPYIQNVSIPDLIEFYDFMGSNMQNRIKPEIQEFLEQQVLQALDTEKHKYLNPGQVLFAGQYFLELSQTPFKNREKLTQSIENVLQKQFMGMDTYLIERYISFFKDNNLQIKNETQYSNYLLISKFNKNNKKLGSNRQKKEKKLQIPKF